MIYHTKLDLKQWNIGSVMYSISPILSANSYLNGKKTLVLIGGKTIVNCQLSEGCLASCDFISGNI